jgi:AraC-like DNA-binding protein
MPNYPPPPQEYAQLRAIDGREGAEVMRAQFHAHRFAPHAHDTWAFGAVVAGAKDNAPGPIGGNIVRTGEITVLRPGQVHAGRAVGGGLCRYVMIYVPDEMLRRLAEASDCRDPDFSQRAITDGPMVDRMAGFVEATLNAQSAAPPIDPDVGIELETIIAELLLRHGRPGCPEDRAVRTNPDLRLRRARDLLHSQLDRPVTLRRLADEIGLSPYHLCRRFAEVYGLPPHRYHLVLRLRLAKNLIKAGGQLADIAQATGFADQSHLGRHFKECFGFSPGGLLWHRRSERPEHPQ